MRYGARGTLRGRRRGTGTLSGPRVNVTNLGSPCRETTRNWAKVIRFPDLGYSDVTCSKVRALLSQVSTPSRRRWEDVPTTPTKDEAQSNKPVSHQYNC